MQDVAEWAERLALADLARAAAEQGVRGLIAEEVGPALVLRSPGFDSPLLNRVIGLGSAPGCTEAELDAALARFRRDGTTRFFVQLYDDALPRALPDWLAARNIVRYRRSWHKLARGSSEPLPEASTRLSIRPARAGDANDVAEIFAQGFDVPQSVGSVFAGAIGRQRWRAWVAVEGPRVAAAALSFATSDVAYLAGAATRREYRGRGAQLALLVTRCRAALDAGCKQIVSETGEPAAGDPQHSHHNLERCGLRVIEVRHNYAPLGALWHHGAPG